ncbi:SCO family protein [Thalassomonas haliotis]|uniref:SCO family protein n=1 Tax=Thalassomonas haliotis TaxID=485448 RepID=A0ABY7VDA8_9GAMM|nr:SCO family protein [Thalassomonas haliotis]WDE11659.1 SCO family protein [Thalassomonas haliotis]
MNKMLYVLVALLALVSGLLFFYQVAHSAPPKHALYYQQPRAITAFELTDHTGEVFDNQDLVGNWSWVFFGYTSCPDVCPTTLQELNFIYEDLKAISDNSQILLVSVDPGRDSQEKLAQYIGYFNPEFKALRGGHSVLFPFARNLGLMYAISGMGEEDEGDEENENYLVDHSASLVLINPDGNISAIFKPEHEIGQPPGVNGEVLVEDFARIVKLF